MALRVCGRSVVGYGLRFEGLWLGLAIFGVGERSFGLKVQNHTGKYWSLFGQLI